MAMLAGPKYRKRYNLVPRGKALFDDDTRFGTKMLEKMGWSKGKGLGANEDGATDFVRVKYKNDAEGFGYEDRDDQWTQHEESFSGLLNSLQGKTVDDNNKSDNEEANDVRPTMGFGFKRETTAEEPKGKLKAKISGESLEEKSRNSRARVHYQKFTRGKDLSRYSEKDLANIFGRTDKQEEQKANEIYAQFGVINVPQQQDDEEQSSDDEEKKNQNEKVVITKEAGVPTINTGLSVSDYFKMKMDALKKKMQNAGKGEETKAVLDDNEDHSSNDGADLKHKKKKQKRSKAEEELLPEEAPQKKKKKQNEELVQEVAEVDQILQKQSKKNKKQKVCAAETENTSEPIQVKEKSKKKKKHILESEDTTTLITDEVHETEKPKKKKQKVVVIDDETPLIVEESQESEKPKKKKQKNTATEDEAPLIVEEPQETEKPKKKKKRVAPTEPEATLNNAEIIQLKESDEIQNAPPKKSTDQSKKSDKKSTNENDVSVKDDATLNDLIEELKKQNILQISSFCAEKFRILDVERFKGSSLSQIAGYDISEQIELDIVSNQFHEKRLMDLWNGTLSKYNDAEPKYTYKKFVNQTYKARKTKTKAPRLHVKSFKRKHVFSGI